MISNKLHLYHQLYDFYHIKVNPDHISSTKVLVTLYHTIKEKEITTIEYQENLCRQ
jgi:hypothetical protein